ncbi:ESPR-type extended signal peptide-containing protein [Glaesserella parasuis]|uniref:ESPR-type extended signal peptide-containing protein n=2 Tax=Glaesserella parasuis TaxID=738 RepID=A0AAJ6AB04_GLAPU|nr:ESPR-type extended signal peptide-containing protein [Glaesserella parasuis]MDG6361406.1 ESPR-type extended signal peptide-containing protein [Glaesserella parasuis]MDO9814257.1 ESPR-type extended signal peptide-containing protein [Glaesserella parasuis]WGE09153.1 ESPR-type extended signal peptide-containing protein [Glaesserella parasuis]
MNKIFRVIWSHAQQAWVVVSELVKSHGKSAISIDKRISPNFSAVLLEQQNGFSLSPVTKAILVGLLGLSFADFAYSAAVYGNGATDNNDWSNVAIGDQANALNVGGWASGDNGSDNVVIGYKAKTVKGGHKINPNLGNGSGAVVIGAKAQAVEGAIAIGKEVKVQTLYGIAIGRDATVGVVTDGKPVSGEYSIAIGSNEGTHKTEALGDIAIAMGRNAKARGYASIALGWDTQANATSSLAMMYAARATGIAAVAIGRETSAGDYASALGNGAKAEGTRSIAIGTNKDANGAESKSGAEATGEDSIALGTDATASAAKSIAIGRESKAEGDHDSVAIGQKSNAKAYGTAVGSNAKAETDSAALGNTANASTKDSVALGAHTQATGRAAVAIGSSAIADSNGDVTRSIASARNTIAIGGGKASQIEAISIGAKSQATQTQSIAIGSESSASAAQAVTIGSNTVASGYGAISIGGDDLNTTDYHDVSGVATYFGTTASGKASVAIGGKSNAIGDGSVVVGPASRATNKEGVVIGAKSSSIADYGIAVGSSATAGSYAVAVGKSATASQTGTSAFGEFAEATAQRATALGNHSKADVENGVALGYMSKTTRNATNNAGWKQDTSAYSALNNNVRTATHAAVAVGNDTTGSIVTRQITGVAAGSQDTDAVNLAQLKALTLNIKGQDNTTGDVTLSTETLELVGEKGIATTVDQANGKTKIKIRGSTTTYKADGGMSNNKLSNDTIGYIADSPSNTVSILTTYDWEDPNGGNAQKYKGENIQSIRKENGDFYLGIKESPTFKTVTASESVTVTGGPTISTNGIDMGNKQITNLAEGTQNDHAVNKGQLDNATVTYFHTNTGDRTQGEGDQATNKGKITDKAGARGRYSITAGVNAKATADYGAALGHGSMAGSYAVAVGNDSKATGTDSVAVGNTARTTGADSVAVGAHINVTGEKLVAIGRESKADGYSVALGYKSSAGGTGSVAVGEMAVTNENVHRATALGNNSIVTVGGGVALGYGSRAETAGDIEGAKQSHSLITGTSTVENGFKSTREANGNVIGAVSVGTGAGNNLIKRQIVNVAAGKELTDAVNVAQLQSLTMQTGGDNSSSGKVGIWNGKLEVKGTNGEIKTNASGSTITISLDDTIKNQLANARTGSLTFKGEKTETGATNDVSGQKWNANEDKTVTIASSETYESNGVRYKGDNVEIYRKNLNNGNTEFHVLMKDAPTFSSVQYGDNGPKITSAGSNLKVTGADGSSPVKITNVANGEQDNDAVNFSQLNPLITKITNLESKQIKYFSVNSTGGGNVNNDGATKSNAIAIGRDATASQNQAVALGKGATSNGLGAVAIGGQFDTEEEERTYSMNQDGSREVHSNAGLWAKVQYNAEKKEGEVGKTRTTQATSASGMYSVAIGSKTRAEGNGALALGYAAYAKGGGVALGLGAAVGESDGISIGTFSATKAAASIALGYFAKAENKHSLAFGRDSKAAKDGGVALGFKSEATIAGGQIGAKQAHSVKTEELKSTEYIVPNTQKPQEKEYFGAVSVGKADGSLTRQIVGVAAGTADTDATNVAQLKSLTMKIGGNTNETTQPKVGLWEGTLNVKGENGLTSHASGDTITVKLTDEIKQKIDDLETKVNNQGITFKGNTGQTGSIKLGDTLKVEGVTDETVVTASTDKLALGLAQKVKDEIAGKMSSFKIKANDTGEQEITNGNTIVFKNGKNINVTRNDKELTFATTETPEFTSVQYGNDGPKITKDNDGNLKVTKVDGNAPVKITNVAEGTETNDAVNKGQLDNVTVTYFHTNTGEQTQGKGEENTNKGKITDKAGATGKYAVTAGVNTKATANQAVAIGKDTKATASSAIAIGSGKPENPNGLNLIKARYNPTKKEVEAGHGIDPTDTETVASGSMSLAIGGLSQATGHVSVALGAYSYALGHEAIAIGSRTAASGAAAVAIGSFSAASGGDAVAIGWGAKARGDFSAALGLNAKALNKNAIAIGNGATAGIDKDTTNISTVAIGESAVASHKETIAIGKGAKATAEKAISIGTGNTVSGAKSGAIGDPNTVSGAASYVMGNDNTVTHTKAFVLGNNVTTGADDSVYLGDSSAVNTGDSSGGVTSAVASGEINGITYGNFAATTPVGVVTVGAATKERRIQNVAAGKISATSTDAINGSQLYLTNNVIGNIAKTIKPILGGDADYKTSGDEAGKFTMTNIGATGKNNIHDAIIAAKSVVKAGKNISSVDTKNETDGSKTYTVNAYKTTVAAKEGDNIINIEGGNAGDDNVLAYKIGVNKDEIKKLVTAAPSNIKYKANSTGEQTVSLTEGLDFTNGTHTKATVGANGVVTFDLNESAVNKLNMVETVKSGNEDKITVTSNNNNTSGGKEFVVNLTEKVTSDIAKGVEAKNTVDTQGITFKGDNNGAGVTKKLGETLMIEGGDNITTKAENDKVTVNLDNNVNLTANGSVKFGDDKNAQLNKDGLIVKTDDNPTASIEVTKTGIKAGDKKITNVANGDVSANSKDAVTGSQLHNLVKVNGKVATKDNDDSVNFVDGNATTAKIKTDGDVTFDVKVDDSSIKIDEQGKLYATVQAPKTTTLTVNNGSVVVPNTEEDKAKFVNAGNLATTLNDMGFNVTTDGGSNLITNSNDTGNRLVKVGEVVKFYAGDNLEVGRKDNVFTYRLKNALTGITSIANGADNNATKISLTGSGDNKAVDVHGAKITNVAKPTENNDAANKKYVDDTNTIVAQGAGVTVQKTTETTGANKYTVSVNTGALATTTNDGKLSSQNAGVATVENVVTAVNAGYWTAKVNDAEASKVKFGDSVNFVNGKGTVAKKTDSGITFDANLTSTDSSVTITEGQNGAINLAVNKTSLGIPSEIKYKANSGTDVKSVAFDTGFNFSNGTHTVATVGENGKVTFDLSSDAANKLNQVDSKMSSFKIKANSETNEATISNDNTIVFKDGKNINVTRSNKELTFATVATPEFTSVQYGNGGPKITSTGSNLKVTGSDGNTPVKITNVAAGDVSGSSSDVVNGKQLHDFIKVNDTVVNNSGSVDFANSTTAIISAENGKVKVNVNTGTSKVGDDGKAAPTDNTHDSKIVTVKDMTDRMNATFWKASTDKEGTGKQAEGTASKLAKVKAGDEVKFKAGNNLIIKQDGTENRDFTYSLNKDLDLQDGSIKFNTTTATTSVQLDEEGLTITKPANSGDTKSDVKLTASGLDNGKNKIINVAKPEADTDAANKKYVDDGRTEVVHGDNIIVTSQKDDATGKTTYTVKGKKTTVSKVDNSPITVSADEEVAGVTNYKIGIEVDGTTIEVKDGKLASKVVDTDKSAKVIGSDLVTVETAAAVRDEGITKVTDYTVKVKKGAFGNTTDGKIVTGNSEGVATVSDVVSAVNAGYWTAKAGDKTKNISFGNTLTFANGEATEAKLSDDGKVSYDVKYDGSTITKTTDGKLQVNTSAMPKTTFKVNHNDQTEDQAATVADGNVVTFKQGKNISIARTDKEFTIATSDTPTFNSVTINNVPTADNHAATKKYVDDGRTTVQSSDQSISVDDTDTNANKYAYDIKVNYTKVAENAKLSYKANNAGEAQKVALSTGLNFTNTDNITASVEAGGVVKHSLNENLKGITSIANGDDDTKANGAKITLSSGSTNKTVDVNEAKITNVAAGTISDSSKDAINGTQLHNFIKVNNEAVAKDGVVKFIDGTGTTVAKTDNGEIKVNVNTGTFGNPTADGKLSKATDGVATVENVVNAVNTGYWTAKVNNTEASKVKFGDAVNFVNGKGTVARNVGDGKITFDANLTSTDGSVTIENKDDGSVSLTVNKNSLGIPNSIKYKANGGNNGADVKSVAFDTGFNFSNGTHTVATVDNNGKVTFDLNETAANKLNQVDNKMSSFKIKANNTTEETIADGDTVVFKDGKNINITRSDKELTVKTVDAPVFTSVQFEDNGPKISKSTEGDLKVGKGADGNTAAKITNVADGKLAADSKDAVTGKQLKDLAGQVGVEVNTDKTTFKQPEFTKLKATSTDATEPKEAKTVVAALDETRVTVNKGLKFKGEETENKTITKQLGETLTITSGDITKDGVEYKASNLRVESDGTNIEIGLKENPEFKAITVKDGNNTTTVGATSIKVGDTTANDNKPVTITVGENGKGGSISNLETTLTSTNTHKSATKPAVLTTTNAATLGDVLNAGWNLQGNGSAVDFVRAYDKVNFANGIGTTVNVSTDGETSTIKVDITKGELSVNSDGKVVDPVPNGKELLTALKNAKTALDEELKKPIEGNSELNHDTVSRLKAELAKTEADVEKAGLNKVATVKEVADAINNAGWKAETTGTNLAEGDKNQAGTTLVKPGNTVQFEAGDNLLVGRVGNKFTYSLNKTIDLTDTGSITFGNDGPTLNNTGLTIGTNGPKVLVTGIDAGNQVISNVADPTDNKHAANKQYVDNLRTTVTSSDQSIIVTDTDNGDKYAYDIKVDYAKVASNAVLTYKSNNGTKEDGTSKTVTLSKGLDFTNTTNITASIEDNGVVKHTLNSELKGIDSIASKTADGNTEVTKIELSKDANDKKVTLNDAKLTGLADGAVSTTSTDAISGQQLHNFIKVGNNAVAKDGVVKFANGTGTTINTTTEGTIKVDVNTTALTMEETGTEGQKTKTGKVATLSEDDKSKLVTAETVANAINNSAWIVTSETSTADPDNKKGDKLVKAGEKVSIEAGSNLLLKQDDKKFTYSLNPVLTDLTSAQFKAGTNITNITSGGLTTTDGTTTTTVNPNTIKVGDKNGADGQAATDSNPITISSTVKDGKTVNTITGLTNNLPETVNMVGGTKKQDAPTAEEIAAKGKNAATVSDILNAGWNLQGNGAEKDFVRAYDTVNFVDGSGTTVTVTPDITGSSSKVKVSVDTGKLTVTDGKVVDPLPNAADLETKLADAKKALQDELNKPMDNSGVADHSKVLELAAKVEEVEKEVNAAGLNKVATVKEVADAINKSGFKLISGADGGTNSTAETLKTDGEIIKPGDVLTMKAGKNIAVTHTAQGNITFATIDTPVFSSVQFGDNNGPKISKDDNGNIKVGNKDGEAVKVTNVAKGEADTDAVNVKQLKDTVDAAATDVVSNDGSIDVMGEVDAVTGKNTYDLSVKTSAITVNAGNREAASDDKNGYVKANDVVNAINKTTKAARTEIIDGKNTKANVYQTGVDGQDIYKIDVEGDLTGITSIANGNNDAKDNGAKISLSEDPNNKVVTLNDAKLTGLTAGDITDTSKDAMTGKQLKDLADEIGVGLETGSTTAFKKPEFTKLKANKDTNVTAKEAKTVVEALEETRNKVNEGLKFKGEEADDTKTITKQLGETLEIQSGDITNGDVAYKGGNLRVESDGTKIEIGLKENPEFKEIKVKDGDQTTTVTNNAVTIGAKDQNSKPITISVTDNANTISGLTTAITDPDTADTKAKSKDKPNNLTTTNAATLGDVLNAGWNLKANDDDLDFVRPYDSVRFQDGAGTFVTTDTDGKNSIIQIDIDNGTLTTTEDGKVKGIVTAEESKAFIDKIVDAETELRDAEDELAKARTELEAIPEGGNNAEATAKVTAATKVVEEKTKAMEKAYDDADKAGLNKVATAQNVAEAINNSGWRVTAGKTTGVVKGEKETLVKPSDLVTFKAGDNIVIEQDGSNFTFALSDTVKTNAITVGEKGADGKDGTIGVNGKDGSAVVINGKDGSIGLNGKDGANGVTIKGGQGQAGVDGADSEKKTRIVYEYTDPKSPNTPIKEEIATLKDGQKYSGDNYVADNADTVIKKKLNERLEIKGGVTDETKLSDNNIGVIAENGVLNVRLAKNINLGNDGSVTTGNTKVDNNGITIKKPADAGDGKSDVKLTASGLDNGGNTIINVAAGVADTDAVNVKQLKDTVNAAATDVVSNDGSIDVMGEVDAVTGKNTYDLSVKTSGLTSSPDKKTVNADVTGKAFATAETVANAINTATAAATSEVISTNGSVSINEMTGDKGQNIYDLEVTRSELSISDDGKTVTSGTAGEAFVTGDDVANVVNKAAASARTEVADGKNTKVVAKTGDNGQDIYNVNVEGDLADISSVANGKTKISLAEDKNELNVNKAKITNVADGVAANDAVNVSQLTAAAKGAKTEVESSDASVEVTENRGDNGQTVYDLAVVKSKLNAAEDKRTVAAETKGNAFVTGEEVAKAINTTTAAARTEVTDGRNTQVVATTGENGQEIYNVSVSGLPMEYATEDGKSIINMGGNFYLEEPTADGSIKLIPVVNAKGKFSTKTQNPDGSVTLKPLAVKVNLANEAPMVLGNVAEGVADTDAVNVKQLKSAKTEVESTDHSVVIKERQGDNQQIVYDLTVAKTKLTASEDKRTISAEDKGNHFATGDEVAAAINTATAAARTEVEAGKNVKVTSKTGANGQNIYNVSVSGDLSDITSISNGDTKVSLGKDKQGNPVVNMNGARITNIGDGSAEGDVVNVRQLNKVVSSVNAGFNQLSKDIGRVDVNARAGIASAGAMANLSQVYLPGKSAISVSGAQYRGQAAYAIGYSRISDNGKWLIRASVSSNTQRDTMIGGGASFVW